MSSNFQTLFTSQKLFRKEIALPQDHGSWVFILSPLLIGIFAAGQFSLALIPLCFGLLSAFLIRQPITTLVKIYNGRRSSRDQSASIFWMLIYGGVALISLIILTILDYGYIFFLAIPGIPVFIWHLWLVSRRAERRQAGVEILGSGVLALAAPAAYWVGIGAYHPLGWWLFVLVWFQSAASIVYAYFRLEQRSLNVAPDLRTSLKMARRSLLYTSFNFVAVLMLSIATILPPFLFLPYLLQWGETVWGIAHPATGMKPTQIGVRQLIVSSLFTILFIWTW